ncbi:MAG: transcription-repair coupling factor [Sphaerochaetaceae bacterium]|nr:transcription-repair coupling factor [Sphaerochaetaceae bacterium]
MYIKQSEVFKHIGTCGYCNFKAEGLDGFPLFECARMISSKVEGNTFLICPTDEAARQIYSNVSVNNSGQNCVRILLLQSSGRVMYSGWEGSEKEFEQLNCLGNILNGEKGLIITSIRAICMPLVPASAIEDGTIHLKAGDRLDTMKLASMLGEGNYFRGDSTFSPGDFSVRGEVVDVFPFGDRQPLRIYLDWDSVEKICRFDPVTQKITKQLGHADIRIYGISGEFPLQNGAFASYVSDEDFFIFAGDQRLDSSYKSLGLEAKAMFRKAYQEDRNSVRPDEILFDFDSFRKSCKKSLTVCDIAGKYADAVRFELDGPRSYFGNFTFLKEDLKGLEDNGWDIHIYASTELQKERLSQMLSEFSSVKYHTGNLSGGFSIRSMHFIAICESEIFGRRKQVVKTLQHTQTSVLDSFVELHEGDFVVHVNYGIGKFLKIDRIRERDYIKIQFAEKENLYVPIEQANLVQRYIGSAGEAPHLDRLGSGSWENKKAKARKSAEDLANHLIELYARRKNSTGFPFAKDNDWQIRFEAEFEFDETEDQLACIRDVKEDMESTSVMDRLICGDVGYGKTEIAFRAAFKAVMSGKQVAFLAPTTILAEQHCRNFEQRLHDFPVKTALLTRMVAPAKQKKIISQLKDGQTDVLFGTHRIIQKDIVFSNLGLLIVDEEQRFGVKDKDRIKELKASVDCLSLSATPIPRTLYMSLLKIRDMSLLTTPPIDRKPIKTVIERFDESLVEQAIRREIERHGQVFFLHNRIETLEAVASMIRRMIPEAVVETAHGQMRPEALEDTMRRFVYEGIQVLVSTTIIENGIDSPNVNTIIIDRADMYGVSQLYQLKGRVGRSGREAYAYLLYPSDFVLSEQSIKRLQIISEHTQLGSGFKIAMKDMELRGAGNLLGKEQSGFMASVGLDMYIRLLDEEISKIRKTENKDGNEVFLELDYSGFIPDSYVSDSTVKLEIYKKIASIRTDDQLERLTAELKDRFGNIPEEVSNLLYICELRIICRKLDIYHIKERNGSVLVEFSRIVSISVDSLIDMIKTSNGTVTIDPKKPNMVTMKTDAISLKDKSLFILEKLQRLVP